MASIFNIHIGTIKITSMQTASTFTIGESYIANRNNSKSNAGPTLVGTGSVKMPIYSQITYDPDQQDTIESAGENRIATPWGD